MAYQMLKSHMVAHGDNQASLAAALGISLSRFNAKLNRTQGADFTLREIREIKRYYHLTPDDVDQIFFTDKVS